MKNIAKEWDRFARILDDVRESIDQVLEFVPQYGQARKARTRIEKRWQDVIDAADGIDELIGQQTEPVPIEFPWSDDEFASMWQLYKDYLAEQHNLIMHSRMENGRLKYILKFSNNDRAKAIELIEYYISYGGASIFPVNFTEIPSKDDKTTPTVSILRLN